MIEDLSKYSGRIAKVDGPARSGKTEVLVRRCAKLLEQGVDARLILVVVSSNFAGDRFRQRLMQALGKNPEERLREQVSRVVVSCALDVCVSILDEPAVRAQTGRVPRILNDGEQLFFIEDLKTLGQKNQRLHNMLLFFYAQWSEFNDEVDWVIPGEETSVLNHARNMLSAYEAMLRHEAPYLCGKFLQSDAGRPFAQRYEYVFCDDFQNLSHAEQICMCLCARKQVMVCGNTVDVTKVNTDYPYPKGFGRFERLRRGVDVNTLSQTYEIEQVSRFAQALCATEDRRSTSIQEPSGAKALFLEWETPEEELAGIDSLIRSYEKSTPNAKLSDIVIAVPNKHWGRLVQVSLKKQGIRTSSAGLLPCLGGDPRAPGQHDALSAYVKLSLVADSRDLVAWRAWIGFDDALTNSEAWNDLQKNAKKNGGSLYDALVNTTQNDVDQSTQILKRSVLEQAWHSGQAIIAQCRNLYGNELAQALGLTQLPLFDEMLDTISGDEDAIALCKLIRNGLARPRYPHSTDLVHLALYENLVGLDYECLIAPGMVEGLLPFRDALDDAKSDDKREQILDDDRRRLRTAIQAGTKYLVTSMFTQTDIETAERAKMKVARIASVKGSRVALIKRSTFFDEAGEACPSFVRGSKETIENYFKKTSQQEISV